MQYSVVEIHHLIKSHSFNIQKYGLGMYFCTSQKITLFFLPPSRLFAYLDLCVLKNLIKNHSFDIQKYGLNMYFSTSQKINFIFNYLPLNSVKLVWEGSGNQ